MTIPVAGIIAYESGEATDEEVLCLFSDLVRTGLAWRLQGHYGRTAERFIRTGMLAADGTILREGL
jgi:hypothetical protein